MGGCSVLIGRAPISQASHRSIRREARVPETQGRRCPMEKDGFRLGRFVEEKLMASFFAAGRAVPSDQIVRRHAHNGVCVQIVRICILDPVDLHVVCGSWKSYLVTI